MLSIRLQPGVVATHVAMLQTLHARVMESSRRAIPAGPDEGVTSQGGMGQGLSKALLASKAPSKRPSQAVRARTYSGGVAFQGSCRFTGFWCVVSRSKQLTHRGSH